MFYNAITNVHLTFSITVLTYLRVSFIVVVIALPKIPWMNGFRGYGSTMVNYGKRVWSTMVDHG